MKLTTYYKYILITHAHICIMCMCVHVCVHAIANMCMYAHIHISILQWSKRNNGQVDDKFFNKI